MDKTNPGTRTWPTCAARGLVLLPADDRPGHDTDHMPGQLRAKVLPDRQRRSLDDLQQDLDLSSGDSRSKQSAFWTMLTLSAVIAACGILTNSTATVIGAMIIAPLSTPIMASPSVPYSAAAVRPPPSWPSDACW